MDKLTKKARPEWKVIIDLIREVDPVLFNRIGRRMLHFLFKHNIQKIDQLLRRIEIASPVGQSGETQGENQPMPRLDFSQLERIIDETFFVASQELEEWELLDLISIWMKQERSLFLIRAAEKRDVSLAEITEALNRFQRMPTNQVSLTQEERIGVRVALIRRFFTENLEYLNTTKHCVSIADFSQILSRTIGPSKGNGKLGGKAAGLFRAARIVEARKVHNKIFQNIQTPKTWYITSDGLLEFMNYNALDEMPTIKYREISEIKQEYNYLGQIFKNSFLPPEIISGLKIALDDFGDKPLIVRSSSLLEDSRYFAFAGKYKSLFVANQGTREERLEALQDAIVEVYASTFGPDPIEYRRERGLLDFNEEMGIMIQEVVGQKAGNYYFPAFAGVAFSYNEFRWSPRIKREDGIIRFVAGLGTRAVDRMGEDYPTLISPGQPGLRTNITFEEVLKYSQKFIDVINLESGRFETRNIEDLIKEVNYDFPQLSQVISICKENQLHSPMGLMTNLSEGIPVVTFSNLLRYSPFIEEIKAVLSTLKESLGWPVDIEFAAGEQNGVLYLLQCRCQSQFAPENQIRFPVSIPADDQLFSANRYVTSCQVHGIEYLVYVDPFEYDNLSSMEEMVAVGRIVGELNARLPERKFILMGPGRWGSRGDIKLGVRVAYSDINRTCMLIEIARKKMDYTPDLSFGTHFFQDLVEAEIRYLPLYPDDPEIVFNEAFFRNSPNHLSVLLPHAREMEAVIRVIHVPLVAAGAKASIVMDGEKDRALGFLNRET